MKKFAFFLPQFHSIPENDLWWGKGFTEWTKVKNAKPLFPGHHQPQKPLNENYYCLLNKETVEWQTNLLHEYGLDGFIYYHYYFDGKLLLEKPAENLLSWKDIDQDFFFCWANHTWNRSWEGKREVLIEQTYGDEKSWKKHFDYLLPFFLDKRYEKRDNRPIFMLFNSEFNEKSAIFNCFDQWCRDAGFDGIYVIETYKAQGWPNDLKSFKENACAQCKKILFRESTAASSIYRITHKYTWWWFVYKIKEQMVKLGLPQGIKKLDGNRLYQTIIDNEPFGPEYIHSVFFGWDNTPRHGFRGFIISPPSEEMFCRLMEKVKDDDYLFINAWNEWAEGMMLEPTEENKYKYLHWLSKW